MGEVGSIYDLIECYLSNQDKKIDNNSLNTVKITLIKLQELGFCFEDVYKFISRSSNVNIKEIFTNINATKTVYKNNIFKKTTRFDSKSNKMVFNKYYHNELIITPKPIMVCYDIETGEFVRDDYEYFLEYKYSYTLENLYTYYISKDSLYNPYTIDKQRTINHLRDLVNRYGLEDVLWMIDASNSVLLAMQYRCLNNPYGIVDYYNLAQELKIRKKSDNIANGCDKVVPRKRLLLS